MDQHVVVVKEMKTRDGALRLSEDPPTQEEEEGAARRFHSVNVEPAEFRLKQKRPRREQGHIQPVTSGWRYIKLQSISKVHPEGSMNI